MIANVPTPILCVLSFFYLYGLFVIISGRAWNRWTGKTITGAPARLGGVGVIGMGILFTLLIAYPARSTIIMAVMFLWIVSLALVGRMLFGPNPGEDQFGKFARIPPDRSPKRKRKHDDFDY